MYLLRFDVHNNGFLSEDEWVVGWVSMVSDPDSAKTLARIHSLASDLE